MRFKGLFKFLDSFSGQLLTLIIGGIVLFQVANFAVVCSVQWLYVQQAEQTRAEHLASYWTLLNSMPAAQLTLLWLECATRILRALLKKRLEFRIRLLNGDARITI